MSGKEILCNEEQITKTYKAVGIVLGNNWGGGKSTYPAKVLKSDNLGLLNHEILAGVESGSLDAGMGFASLKGALIKIEVSRSVVVNGCTYYNSYCEEPEWFGEEISEGEMDFCYESLNNF